jgi:hypothetical protein
VWFFVPGLVVPLALWCTGSLFAMDFPFVPERKNKTSNNNPSEHQFSNRHKNKEPNLRKWVDRTSVESLCKEREQTNGNYSCTVSMMLLSKLRVAGAHYQMSWVHR